MFVVHLFVVSFSLIFRYLADLQQRLREKRKNEVASKKAQSFKLHWDFLPPGDAHNRCDAAAAHWKRPQKKLICDFCVLTTVGHLAFACSELKNCYIIEAECEHFPDPLECVIEESWMREAFHFEYGVPGKELKECHHACKNKKSCLHNCCKNAKLLPNVWITISDRAGKYAI